MERSEHQPEPARSRLGAGGGASVHRAVRCHGAGRRPRGASVDRGIRSGAEPKLNAKDEAQAPHLAELLVPLGSNAVGQTVKQLDVRRRYGVNALALQRHGHHRSHVRGIE